ncbi:right-handed parallel beta-helix repeat-containing protein, partial [Prolixibacteraceae bacterium JC049]|nr:right-handed parallel beta-helix repeat-containing protein [Prolixibacteraceae bacterium JC049]
MSGKITWKKISQCMLGMIVFLLTSSSVVFATDYNVSADATSVIIIDGTKDPYKSITGGDRIIFESGDYRRVRFANIHGVEGNPIVITNAGGQCVMGHNCTMQAAGISFDNCSYVHITGTGDAGTTYGFKVQGKKGADYYDKDLTGMPVDMDHPHLGVGFGMGSTNFEADHIEICDLTGIGVLAKTLASSTYNRSTFTQENTVLHDIYIHNVNFEGFYVGSSFYLNGLNGHYPPNLHGVQVYNNIIEGAGWTSLAVKCAIQDNGSLENAIYGNRISDFAKQAEGSHDNAIQVGGGSKMDVYNNHINNGHGSGIEFHGHEGTMYNNIIVDAGVGTIEDKKKSGIWIQCKDEITGHSINAYNNTIINPRTFGIRSSDTTVDSHAFKNNIVVGASWGSDTPEEAAFDNGGNSAVSAKWTLEANYATGNIADVKFLDAAAGNYILTAESPAFEQGVDVGVATDYYGNAISAPYHIGAYSNKDENGEIPSSSSEPTGNDYYWVGGTGNWSDYQNHWATTSGGTTFHDQIPTLQDNVHFDDNSFTAPGQVVTMDNCLVYANNFDWSGLTNTTYMPTLTSSSPEKIDIRGDFTLSEHMVYNVTDVIDFSGESGTINLTTKGRRLGRITITAGATYSCQDDLTLIDGATFSNGGLKVNNNILQMEHPDGQGDHADWSYYSSKGFDNFTLDIIGSEVVVKDGVRLTLASSSTEAIILSDGTTDITISNGRWESVMNVNKLTARQMVFDGGAMSGFYGAGRIHTFTIKGNTNLSGWVETENLNILQGAKVTGNTVDFILSETSTFNLESGINSDFTEFSATLLRFRFTGTIPTHTWEYLALQGVEFRNYYNNNQDNWDEVFDPVRFTANNSIDKGGNLNVKINSPAERTLYWIGDGGDINDPAHWSETSGGPAVSFPPLSIDKVIFDANSFSITGQVVSVSENFYCKGMDCSTVTNSPTLGTGDYYIYSSGDVSFSPNMSVSLNRISLIDAEDGQISTNGLNIGTSVYLESGKWSLQDDFKAVRINIGNVVFNTNDHNIDAEYVFFYTGYALADFGISVVTASKDIRYSDTRFSFPTIKAENAEFIAGGMFNLGASDRSHYFNKITSKTIGLGRIHANEVHFQGATNVVLGGPIDTLSLGADIEMHMATGAAADGSIILTNPVGGPSGASYEYSFDGAATWTTESSKTDCGIGPYNIWMRLAGIESSAKNIQNYYLYTKPDKYNQIDISYTLPSDAKTADGSIVLSNASFADGTTEFEYSLNNGLTWSTQTSYTNLGAGLYFIDIRDKNSPEVVWSYTEIDLAKGINHGSVDALHLDAGVQHQINNRIHFDHIVVEGTASASNMIGIKGGTLKKTGTGDVEQDFLRLEATTADITEGKTYTANNSANMGGVKNWIIDELPARTLYWVGAEAASMDIMDPAFWSLTSGGLPLTDPAEPAADIPPTPVDKLVFDANSCSNGTVDSKARIHFSSDMACANFDASEMTTGYFYNWPIYTLTCTGSFIMNSTTRIYTPNRMPHIKFVGEKDRIFDVGIDAFVKNITSESLTVEMDKDAVLDINSNFGSYESRYMSGTVNFNCDSICAALGTKFGYEGVYSGKLILNFNDVVIVTNHSYYPYLTINATHCNFNSENATIIFNGEGDGRGMYHLADAAGYGASYPTIKLRSMIFTSTVTSMDMQRNVFGNFEIENLVVHGPAFAVMGGHFKHDGRDPDYGGGFKIQNATFHDNAEIYGDNEFGNLTFTPNKVYRLAAGKTQTITNAWHGSGDGANLIEVSSTEPGTRALVSMAAGCVALDRIQLRDMEGVGDADFYLGPNSTNLGNNVGFEWQYGDPLPTPVISGFGGHISSEQKELELTINGSYEPAQVKEINWEVPAQFPILEGSIASGAGTPTIKLNLQSAVDGNKIKCQVNNSTAPCYGPSAWAEMEISVFDPRKKIRLTTSELAAQPAGEPFDLTVEVLESLGEVDYTFNNYTCDITISGFAEAFNGTSGRYSKDGGSTFTSFNGTSITIPGVTFVKGVANDLKLALNKVGSFNALSVSVDNSDDTKEIEDNDADLSVINIVNGPAREVRIVTQPIASSDNGGGVLQGAPVLDLYDEFGNKAIEGTYNVTAAKEDGGDWSLEGTLTLPSSAGSVTFTDLSTINNTYSDITTAQLQFSVENGTISPICQQFTIKKILSAQRVVIEATTTTPIVGADNAVTITVLDGNNNSDSSFDGSKRVTIDGIASAPDGTYGSFNGVAITQQPQELDLNFVGGVVSGSLVLHKAALSVDISVSVENVVDPTATLLGVNLEYGNATQLVMLTQPEGVEKWSGGLLKVQPKVAITDDFENILPTATDEINVTIQTTPVGDNTYLTLSGTTILSAVGGTLTHSDLNVVSNKKTDITAQLVFNTGSLSVISDDFIIQRVGVPTIAITSDPSTKLLDCLNTTVELNASTSTNADGVVSDLSFTWTTSDGNIVSGANTHTLVVDRAGTYTLTLDDTRYGCVSVTEDVLITADQNSPSAIIENVDAVLRCNNTPIVLNAANSVVHAGHAFTREWRKGGVAITGEAGETLSVTEAGTYTLFITDNVNGCTHVSDAIVVTEDKNLPTATIADLADRELRCNNVEIELDGSSSVGFDSHALTYQWLKDGVDIGSATTATYKVTEAGAYTLEVTDTENGCSAVSAAVTITEEKNLPTATIADIVDKELRCNHIEIELDGSSSVGFDFHVLTYQWQKDGVAIGSATTATYKVTEAGAYTLEVTDTENGCSAISAAVVITVDSSQPTATIADVADKELRCNHVEIELDGSSSVGFDSHALTYQWLKDGVNIGSATTATYKVTEAGAYTLEVTDTENGCSAVSAALTITEEKNLPTATIADVVDKELRCNNVEIELDGSSSAGFDSHALTYQWLKDGINIGSATTATYKVTEAGAYTLEVTDTENGCSAVSAAVTITEEKNLPTAKIADIVDKELRCNNVEIELDGSSSVGFDSHALTYQWLKDGVDIGSATTATYKVTEAGAYTLEVTDTENGCSAISAAVTITEEKNLPTATIADVVDKELRCNHVEIELDGSSSAGFDSHALTYQWLKDGAAIGSATTATYTVTEAGAYTLEVTDTENGCSAVSAAVRITEEKNLPTATIADIVDKELRCNNVEIELDGSSSAGFDSHALTYQWLKDGVDIGSATTATYKVTEAGAYTLEVTDTENGCSAVSAVVTITEEKKLPTATIADVVDKELRCNHVEIELDGSSSAGFDSHVLTYQWLKDGA